MTGNKLVTWSLFGTGAVVIVGGAASGRWPEPRVFIALVVIFIILGFAADLAPGLVGPLAVLVFLAVLMYQGAPAFEGTIRTLSRRTVRSAREPKRNRAPNR